MAGLAASDDGRRPNSQAAAALLLPAACWLRRGRGVVTQDREMAVMAWAESTSAMTAVKTRKKRSSHGEFAGKEMLGNPSNDMNSQKANSMPV